MLAERALEGPQSSSLDDRIASPAPSASLPTPPSHKSPWAGTSRRAIEHFGFNETELASVAGAPSPPCPASYSPLPALTLTCPFSSDALGVLLEYYGAQDLQGACEFLSAVASVRVPPLLVPRSVLTAARTS